MIEHQILPLEHVVVVRLEGMVTYDEIEQQIARLLASSNYDPSMSGVLDLRRATPDISPDQAEQLGVLANEQGVARGRWAYLADSPVTTALAMLYREKTSAAHDSEIFSTTSAASRYLGVDVESILNNWQT